MNSTERVMAAINFQKPDKLPYWDVAHFNGFNEKWVKYKNLSPDASPRDYYGYDVFVYSVDECYFPSQRRKLSDNNEYEVCDNGWGQVIHTRKDAYFSHITDSILKDTTDLDKLVFEPVNLDVRFSDLDYFMDKEKKTGRCLFAKVGGIYNRSHFLRPEEQLLVDMALDEGFCDSLFDLVAEYFTNVGLETLKRTNAWETGIWVYDDMASTYNTMYSPAMFERYLLPRYKKMIDTWRKAGCKHFFFHSDGNIGPVLDLLLESGFQGFNPIEPRSGLDLVKLREKYGKRMVFFGGVCNTEILPRGDKKEIEAHVKPLVELGREGGLILGMASISDDVSPEIYDYFMSLVR